MKRSYLKEPGVIHERMLLRLFLVIPLLLSEVFAEAQQVPPLERVVTIHFEQEKIGSALSRLSEKGKLVFSYSPSVIDANEVVSGSFSNRTVREILNKIFSGTVQYKERGNYVILIKAEVPASRSSTVSPLIISGYVLHSSTGDKIANASVYDKRTLTSGITNEFGFFQLKIEKPSPQNWITVSKRSFLDTAIIAGKGEDIFVNIFLAPEAPPMEKDTVSHLLLEEKDTLVSAIRPPAVPEKKASPKESQVNMENIKDTLYSKYQVSFLPFVGTNKMLSGNVVNDYSLNVLGGYALGNRKVEVAGVFNVDRGNVSGTQLAGVFNAVGGDVHGTQFAGSVNITRGQVRGAQVSGALNVNFSGVYGPQLAGVLNVNGKEGRGFQLAGVGNFQVHDYDGSQIAGVFNIATHKVIGAQVSGVLNVARKIKGSQVGLINVADSIQGVPVGLISFVRSGYHKIEVASDEVFYANISFRTGVNPFYNIFTAGVNPGNLVDPLWHLGYGVGTAPRLTKRLFLNIDFTSSHVSKGHLQKETFNSLNRMYLGFDFQLAKKFSITAGATLNAYITNSGKEYLPLIADYSPSIIHESDIGTKSHLQMWWGAKMGVRFF